MLVMAAGVYLAAHGLMSHDGRQARSMSRATTRNERGGIEVRESIIIDRPVSEMYRFWRNLENLPRVMRHLESVTDKGNGLSRWVAKAPAGMSVEWDAEVVEDVENSRIVWRSVGDTPVPNEGAVMFSQAPMGRGTEIYVSLTYHPPLGRAGAVVARMLGEEPGRQIAEDLKNFKRYIETGDVLAVRGVA
jgi:uncharacterized membrane protein